MIGAAFTKGVLARIASLPVLILVLATPAFGLEEGFCAPPADMTELLRGEEHNIIATMDRHGYDVGSEEWGFIAVLVTTSPDLTSWYFVSGNKPLGTESTEFCITIAGKNLELNDHRQDRPPTVKKYRFDAAAAKAGCEKMQDAFLNGVACGEHYTVIEDYGRQFKERIALQGESVGGVLVTFVANPDPTTDGAFLTDKNYHTLATTSEGSVTIAGSGERFEFSELVLSALRMTE